MTVGTIAVAAFAVHGNSFFTRQTTVRHETAMYLGRSDPNNEEEMFIEAVDSVVGTLSLPTPGLPQLPIVYPLALVLSISLLPWITSVMLISLFTGFLYLGQAVVGDDTPLQFFDAEGKNVYVGDTISLVGLSNAAFNGLEGVILGPDPDNKGRFTVQLLEEQSARTKWISMKPSNMIFRARKLTSDQNNKPQVPSKTIPLVALGGALGLPLALVLSSALVHWITSVMLVALFTGFLYVGQEVVRKDDNIGDQNMIPLVSLCGALASALLLSPDGMGHAHGNGVDGVLRLAGTAGVGLAAGSLFSSNTSKGDADRALRERENRDIEISSIDEQLLNLWDEKFTKM